MSADGAPTLVDLFAPEWAADPYPFYRRLREHHPVYHDDVLRGWVVSRHDDITALSTDDRLTEDRVTPFQARLAPETRALMRPLAGLLTDMKLFATGTRHTALRGLAKAGFSRRVVAELRTSIERHVARLCDRLLPRGEIDLVGDLSAPLTTTVIAEMLGLPPEHRHLLDDWQSLLHVYFTQSGEESERLARLRDVRRARHREGPAGAAGAHAGGGLTGERRPRRRVRQLPADHRRGPGHHDPPDPQRRTRPAEPSRPAGAAPRPARAARPRPPRSSCARTARSSSPRVPPRPTSSCAAGGSRRVTRSHCWSAPGTATRRPSPTRTAST